MQFFEELCRNGLRFFLRAVRRIQRVVAVSWKTGVSVANIDFVCFRVVDADSKALAVDIRIDRRGLLEKWIEDSFVVFFRVSALPIDHDVWQDLWLEIWEDLFANWK